MPWVWKVVQHLTNGGGERDIMTNNGMTPIRLAACNGHKDVVRLLIDVGAGVDIADSRYGNTPLIGAANNGHADVAILLIDAGADVNVVDNDGRTAIWYAAAKGLLELVKVLLSNGADKSKKDNYGESPFDVACQWDNADCKEKMQQLLKTD